MGKGNRNRNQASAAKNKRRAVNQKKNSWVLPVVLIVLVVAIIGVAVVDSVMNSGLVERNRVIVKSQTGKYDITQQMATYIAWLDLYSFYQGNYDSFKEIYGTSLGDSATSFGLSMAASSLQGGLRDCIDDIQDKLVNYVAVCDAAYKNNITLGETEKASVANSVNTLKNIKNSDEDLAVLSLSAFMDIYIGNGMSEKDVRRAEEVIELYNLYRTQVETEYKEAVTLGDLDTFRLEHPENYYKIDYLSFVADNKELADQLAACKTAEEFKSLVIKTHFDTKYAPVLSNIAASKDYLAVEGKTDDNGAALTDALNQIGASEAKTFTKTEMGDDLKKLSDWLFSTSRKQYQTTLISTDNAEYIVAFMSASANTASVEARVKEYKHADISTTVGEDESFASDLAETFVASERADALYAELNASGADVEAILKANDAQEAIGITKDSDMPAAVIKQVLEMHEKPGALLTATEGGVYYVMYLRKVENGAADFAYCKFGKEIDRYSSAKDQYNDLLQKLNAEGANLKELVTANGAISKTGVTSSTDSATVPSVVTKAIFKDGVAAGNIYTANANDVYYIIYVDEMSENKKTASISYVTFEGDLYFQALYSLRAGFDTAGAAAEESTDNYTPDAEEGSYLAWLSEATTNDGAAPVSKRAEFDTKIIEETKDSKTTYTVYMVINTPMYLDVHEVVNGGYALITDTGHAETAAQIAEQIRGKTGTELEKALRAAKSNANIATLSAAALSDTNLKGWMFSADRTEDEVGVVANKSGNGTYIMIHSERLLSWQAAAKTDYVQYNADEWVAGLVEAGNYAANEKVLDKIGALSTTAATTESTTAATTAPAA